MVMSNGSVHTGLVGPLDTPTPWRDATVESEYATLLDGDAIVLTVYTTDGGEGAPEFSVGLILPAASLAAVLAGQAGRACRVRVYDVEDVQADHEPEDDGAGGAFLPEPALPKDAG